MRYFRDTAILLLGGTVPLLSMELDRSLIFALLGSVILICGNYFFEKTYAKFALYMAFCTLCIAVPKTALFCPVLLYGLLREGSVWEIFLSCFLGVFMMLKTGTYFPNFTFYILFTDIVAVIMSTDNKVR